MAKRCGFPPVYKIERVEKMSVKRVFFGVLQKIVVFCCAIFFGFTNAFSANLSTGYTELEYIESTGTQWIDTGISGFNTGNWEIYAKWLLPVATQTNPYANVFSAYSSENHNSYRIITKLKDSSVYYVSGNSKAGGGSALVADKAINQIHTATARNGSVIFDGETINTPTQGTALPSSVNLGIFARGDGASKIIARIYSVNVKKDGVLIGDFVPAKNASNELGMYDTVRGQFFTNQGTGTFIAGPEVSIRIATTAYNAARFSPVKTDLNSAVATIREIVTKTINQTAAIASLQADKQTRPEDACPAGKKCLLVEDNNGKPHWFPIIENICGVPSGYTCLDYIRSSGTAYIDTGYSPTSQTRIELVAKMDDGAGNVNIVGSGSAESTGASTQALMVINSYTDTEAEIKFGVSGSWDRVPVSMTAKNTFSMSATEFRVNGVVKKTFSGSIANTGNKPFYLFQRWRPEITSATSRVQIYEFNIYENDVLVRHMVPAKQGTTVGMYDTVNDRFYTNAGTGSLTAGPEI